MNVIGFDPSLIKTGYAIIKYPDNKIIKAGYIKTNSKEDLSDRIYEIYLNAQEIFSSAKIEHACFEESFYSKNVKSAVILSQVRTALILSAKNKNCSISLFSPNIIKKAVTGNGHASKEQVAFMIKQVFGIEEEIPDDVSDAIAVAYTFILRSNFE